MHPWQLSWCLPRCHPCRQRQPSGRHAPAEPPRTQQQPHLWPWQRCLGERRMAAMQTWRKPMRHHQTMRKHGPSGSGAAAARHVPAGSSERHPRRGLPGRQPQVAAPRPAQSGSGRRICSRGRQWQRQPLLRLRQLLVLMASSLQIVRAQRCSRSSPAAVPVVRSSCLHGSNERRRRRRRAREPSRPRGTPAGGGSSRRATSLQTWWWRGASGGRMLQYIVPLLAVQLRMPSFA